MAYMFNKKVLSGATLLVASFMFANVLNFLFNAFLGRELSAEDFGLITVLNTIVYLTSLFIGGVGTTVNHRTAYISGRQNPSAGVAFLYRVRQYGFLITIALSLLWVALLPSIAHFFQIDRLDLLFYFTPIITLGVLVSANRGFLQGNFKFIALAFIVALEAASKLLFAILFVYAGAYAWVALSIPLSTAVAFLLSSILARKYIHIFTAEKEEETNIPFHFPGRFYVAAVFTGLATAGFLSVDIIFAKHYLTPIVAGEYALLSLVGKMIFFFGSLLTPFIITFVSRAEGEGKDPNTTFYALFAGILLLVGGAFVALGPLGDFFVPLLFGAKAEPILPYLVKYSLGIMLFTLGNAIVIYHLARKHYIFPVLAFCTAIVLSVGIIWSHDSIGAITHVLLLVSSVNLAIILVLHAFQRNEKFFLANMVDLLNVLYPLHSLHTASGAGKKILIFNWRDTKHAFAGGAELYVHELAKRWVKDGNSVTLFCGNDRKNTRYDLVDGVHIVRRGGFYTVYAWAFIYYLIQFRGKFDVIIDAQNGIPFFTPLYAKEPVYALLHHVHQDVFYKYLPLPLAFFAASLEKYLMPFVYRNTRFITVSESSRQDMIRLGITKASIQVVNPGVDLDSLTPGEKSPAPVIFSIGRLKAYKSIDVLIKAFKKVLVTVPTAQLVIAGDGEEKETLHALAEELGLKANVKFLGKISEAEKLAWFQKAWVFVNPSMMEGWGITTIEANACGVPVVASDIPGLRDSVQNPHTGFLVPYGDTEALARKIALLCTDAAAREKMGSAGLAWAQNFGWNSAAEKFLKILI